MYLDVEVKKKEVIINMVIATSGCVNTTQGDSGDATDDEMVSRKTRSCKEGLLRNGPESDSIDQEDTGENLRNNLK